MIDYRCTYPEQDKWFAMELRVVNTINRNVFRGLVATTYTFRGGLELVCLGGFSYILIVKINYMKTPPFSIQMKLENKTAKRQK